MKIGFFWTFIFFMLCACSVKKPQIKIEKGISYELAKYRKEQISDIIYILDFKIPKDKSSPISAILKVDFTINDLENPLFFDFNEATSMLKSIRVNNQRSEINHQDEHIIIDKSQLVLGKNAVEIHFDAGETSLNRNDDFLYTLLVPDRASTLFPCFDQPDLKANYNLTITAPKDWKVLCGAFEKNSIAQGEFVAHQFETSDLMSTYLFSFVAGKFSEITKNLGKFDMRFLYRENNPEKISESINSIFEIHQKSLDYLENYTQEQFPFQKMDFASIPPFQYGGMEHVGAIQYRESSLFLDKNATQNQLLGRAKLIAHETSHMWFGDLVTMRWFNDVWMKEVFANFMADKIVNPQFPEINHNLSFLMTHYPSAYSEDRTKGTNSIRQYLENLKDAGSLYGRIIYNKAPIMMRQLEYLLGEELFQKGIQEYIKTYRNSNADWEELVSILDKNFAGDLKSWSDVWVNSAGRPIFYEEIEFNEKGNVTKFMIHQKAEDGSNKIWTQSFSITLKDERGYEKTINLKNIGKSFDISSAVKDFKPGQIIYNSDGFGYGVFPIYKNKIHPYKNLKDDVTRGYQFINMYENMVLENVSALETYQIFLEAIQSEKNELISSYLSGILETIYWTFLTDVQQKEIQKITEKKLLQLLESELPANIKKTIFGLYESVAISNQGKENLYQLWNKKMTFQNLFLNENDYTKLAILLAIYEHPKSTEILEIQVKKITNPDRLERFEWLLPSVSKDEKVRDEFMKSLLNKENREKESWVEVGLNNLHHPLRQKSSKKHLKSILEKLEEVQLTGDIFFPKGWLASSIGNYSSREANEILKDFLAENPKYNPILLKKLLQTTDNLTRAQKIKK